ncbi:hypothetical protein [Cellulophaga sp. 20_2_10]|nr:hypothetical protein [Cellulophaga sp. 20_2_10]
MKNKIAIIKRAEQIKALLICSIIAIVPVYHVGYKLGGAIVQLFV